MRSFCAAKYLFSLCSSHHSQTQNQRKRNEFLDFPSIYPGATSWGEPGHRSTPVTLVLLHYYLWNPALSGLSTFPIKVNQLLLTMFKLSSNIPVVLQSSQFKHWDKSIQGFLVMIVRLYKILFAGIKCYLLASEQIRNF